MLEFRNSSSGPIAQTCEQGVFTFPPGSSGDVVDVDLAIKSRLPPGCATYVQVTQHQPNFLILHSDITTVGTLHLHLYYIIEQLAPVDFDCHIVVTAHDLSQL
jgi:hypothetical protein